MLVLALPGAGAYHLARLLSTQHIDSDYNFADRTSYNQEPALSAIKILCAHADPVFTSQRAGDPIVGNSALADANLGVPT